MCLYWRRMYVIYIYYHMRAAAGAEAAGTVSATPRYMVDGDDMVYTSSSGVYSYCVHCVKETVHVLVTRRLGVQATALGR